jgi:hypothetical protein
LHYKPYNRDVREGGMKREGRKEVRRKVRERMGERNRETKF